MKTTLLLLGVNAKNIFGINKLFHGSGKERRRIILQLVGFIALAIILGLSVFAMFYAMALLLDTVGALEMLLSMAVVAASVLTIFDTLFRTSNTLFSFNDYDTLMSLPIKTSSVVISRLASMYIFDLLFSLIVMIPALIAYSLFAAPGIGFCLLFITMTLVLPLIPMAIGIIPGVLIGLLVSKMKHKNIMSLVFSLVLISAYFYMYYAFMSSGIDTMFSDIDIAPLMEFGNSIQSIYLPSVWFAHGLLGSPLDAILFLAISIAAMGIISLILSCCYKKLHDIITSQKTLKKQYRLRSTTGSTRSIALYKREWKHYTSSSIYMLNTAFGYIMLLAAGVLAIIFRNSVSEFFAMIPTEYIGRICIGIAFLESGFIGASTLSSVSISLEGKKLWILQTLPVPAIKIFNTKIFFSAHIAVTVSMLVSTSLVVVLALNINILTALAMFIIPIMFAVFFSVFGLWINLLLPKFNWKTQTQVVKQSATVAIVNVASMFICIALTTVIVATSVNTLLLSIITITVLLAMTIFMFMLLKLKAPKIMLSLSEK